MAEIFRYVISSGRRKTSVNDEVMTDGTEPGYGKCLCCEEPFTELTFGSRAAGLPLHYCMFL